jgi:ABC-type multidrug transport system permease subunit
MRPLEHNPLWQLTLARWRELLREPGILFWTFGFPVVLAIGLGVAFKERPPSSPRVAVEAGADWIAEALEGAAVEVELLDEAQAWEALRVGRVDLVVYATMDGGTRGLRYRFDPVRDASRVARTTVDDAVQRGLGRADLVPSEDVFVSESGSRYVDFLMPGLIGLNLMSSSLWGIAYSVVLNRKRKLLKRVAATPMRRSHYLLAYVLSRLAVLVLEVLALVLVGWLLFGVAVHGSVVALFAMAVLGAASFAGIGLLIAARLDNTEVASGWMNFVMLPMWILSGSFFSYERFPEAVHPLLQALPLTALNDGLRAIINTGASLGSQWPEVAVLAAWGALGFWLALRRFRWQ